MARQADTALGFAGFLLLASLIPGCSSERDVSANRAQVGQAASDAGVPDIVPSPAYGFHELRLGSDVSAATFGGLTGADKGQLVIWTVNGRSVHTGGELDPSYTSPGDRVVVIVKAADASGTWQELSRHETVIQDSAPRVHEVQLDRDSSDPYRLRAVLRADDPDGEQVQIHYRWFVDGVVQEGQAGDHLQLDASRQGAKVAVEVMALDGELRSEVLRSQELSLEGPTISLEVGQAAQRMELEGGGVEYTLSIEHTDGSRLEMLDAPASVSYRSGVLSWRPGEGETQLQMRVRVEGLDGSTVERDISLQL